MKYALKPCAWVDKLDNKTMDKIARIVLKILKDDKMSIFCVPKELLSSIGNNNYLVVIRNNFLMLYIKEKTQPFYGFDNL